MKGCLEQDQAGESQHGQQHENVSFRLSDDKNQDKTFSFYTLHPHTHLLMPPHQ